MLKNKIHITTQGCSFNQSDSEVMAGLLKKEGYEIVDTKEEADLLIINSCTVKDPSQSKALHKLNVSVKPTIITGCVPQGSPKEKLIQGHSIVGVKQLHRIVEAVEETLKGNIVQMLKHENNPRLNLPKIRKNRYIEILPISSGCLGACTYCKTIHARKRLISFDKDAIIKQAVDAAHDGVKEIWVTSQDTGAWGKDAGSDFPTLMWDLAKALEGTSVKIRIGMINPEYVIEFTDAFIELLNHERFFKFLHVPIQSGSNKVLIDMKRKYTIEEAQNACHMIRTNVPGITLATDIIIGFPTEAEEDFKQTLDAVKDIGFEINNISKFYARPKTIAATYPKLDVSIVKKRVEEFNELFDSIGEKNKEYIGKEVSCSVYDTGKEGSFKAHMDNYRHIVIKSDDELLGSNVTVKIIDATRDYLVGELV